MSRFAHTLPIHQKQFALQIWAESEWERKKSRQRGSLHKILMKTHTETLYRKKFGALVAVAQHVILHAAYTFHFFFTFYLAYHFSHLHNHLCKAFSKDFGNMIKGTLIFLPNHSRCPWIFEIIALHYFVLMFLHRNMIKTVRAHSTYNFHCIWPPLLDQISNEFSY